MNCFKLKPEWIAAMELMEEYEQKEFLFAIFQYVVMGKKAVLTGNTNIVFSLVKKSLDTSIAHSQNGVKGGRPKSKTKANEKQMESKTKANVIECQQVTEEEPTKKEKENVSSPNTLSSKRNKKENYIKESSKEISATEQAFIDEFARRFPRAMRMQKPLSYSEFCNIRENIVSEGHTIEEANRIITNGMERLENDPQLNKKYISANLVLQNWHRRGFLSLSKQ